MSFYNSASNAAIAIWCVLVRAWARGKDATTTAWRLAAWWMPPVGCSPSRPTARNWAPIIRCVVRDDLVPPEKKPLPSLERKTHFAIPKSKLEIMGSSWWSSLLAQRVKCLPTMRETWVQSLGWEDPLEKEMASHSSTLAWKIPWTEKPGRLQSMGLQRVRHDWATSLHFHGGPVVETPCCQYRGTGLISGWESRFPHALWYGQKRVKKKSTN